MRTVCEHMIVPSVVTWKNILSVAEALRSTRLLAAVKIFLRDNFNLLLNVSKDCDDSEDEEFFDADTQEGSLNNNNETQAYLNRNYPGLLDEVLDMRRQMHLPPPSRVFLKRADEMQVKRQVKEKPKAPYFTLVILLVAVLTYVYVGSFVVLGNLVPIINITFLLVFGYVFINRMASA